MQRKWRKASPSEWIAKALSSYETLLYKNQIDGYLEEEQFLWIKKRSKDQMGQIELGEKQRRWIVGSGYIIFTHCQTIE